MLGERVIEYGFQPGSQAERIDAVITHAPMNVPQIARAARESASRVRSHLNYWIRTQRFYEKTGDGTYYRRTTGRQPKQPLGSR